MNEWITLSGGSTAKDVTGCVASRPDISKGPCYTTGQDHLVKIVLKLTHTNAGTLGAPGGQWPRSLRSAAHLAWLVIQPWSYPVRWSLFLISIVAFWSIKAKWFVNVWVDWESHHSRPGFRSEFTEWVNEMSHSTLWLRCFKPLVNGAVLSSCLWGQGRNPLCVIEAQPSTVPVLRLSGFLSNCITKLL